VSKKYTVSVPSRMPKLGILTCRAAGDDEKCSKVSLQFIRIFWRKTAQWLQNRFL